MTLWEKLGGIFRSKSAEAADSSAAARPTVEDLLAAVQRQGQQVDTLLRELTVLPGAMGRLIEAAGKQGEAIAAMQTALKKMAEQSDEIVGALNELTEAASKQTETLGEIHTGLTAAQTDSQVQMAMIRLSAATENVVRLGASQKELLEMIRDRWVSANDEFARTTLRRGRRIVGLLVTLLIVASAGVAILAAMFFRQLLVR